MVRRPDLTDDERKRLKDFLLERFDGERLERKALSDAADRFGVHASTIGRLWKKWCAARAADLNNEWSVTSAKSKNGRPLKYDREQFCESIKVLPLARRRTLRSIANGMGLATGTVFTMMRKDKVLRPHSSAIKPTITEEGRLVRVDFCLEHRGLNGLYKDMFDRVHIDEKWFYLTRLNERYYLTEDEPEPHRHVTHKGHIPKVMFMCAVARPRYDHNMNRMWDGKIGIWPFARQEPARRASRNRPQGTMEWKSYNVDRTAYKAMLTEFVIPAIKEKWPTGQRGETILIQQDNAPAHCPVTDPDIWAAGHLLDDPFTIELYCQPANSPDLNVLDLGFFNSIQSLQHHASCSNIGELIQRVAICYQRLEWQRLNDIFLTLQTVMNSIIEHDGRNDYKLQHMGKRRLEREGLLPQSIFMTEAALRWENPDENDDTSDNED